MSVQTHDARQETPTVVQLHCLCPHFTAQLLLFKKKFDSPPRRRLCIFCFVGVCMRFHCFFSKFKLVCLLVFQIGPARIGGSPRNPFKLFLPASTSTASTWVMDCLRAEAQAVSFLFNRLALGFAAVGHQFAREQTLVIPACRCLVGPPWTAGDFAGCDWVAPGNFNNLLAATIDWDSARACSRARRPRPRAC